jgi:hypothetical protein
MSSEEVVNFDAVARTLNESDDKAHGHGMQVMDEAEQSLGEIAEMEGIWSNQDLVPAEIATMLTKHVKPAKDKLLKKLKAEVQEGTEMAKTLVTCNIAHFANELIPDTNGYTFGMASDILDVDSIWGKVIGYAQTVISGFTAGIITTAADSPLLNLPLDYRYKDERNGKFKRQAADEFLQTINAMFMNGDTMDYDWASGLEFILCDHFTASCYKDDPLVVWKIWNNPGCMFSEKTPMRNRIDSLYFGELYYVDKFGKTLTEDGKRLTGPLQSYPELIPKLKSGKIVIVHTCKI